MKKRITALIVSLITFLGFVPCANGADLNVSAQAAVLMCAESGEVLWQRNAGEKLSMASTTKIMTSLIALESGIPDAEITVTKEMVSVEGTSMGLLAGDKVSLRELVYGMLLQSGNDAANTVAITLGGSPENFAAMMNERAKQIGMKNTNFVTASGLDDEEHYSTAFDMALLACECLENPEFVRICSDKSETVTYGNPPYRRTLTNHNKLLWSYPDAIGMKTGFTKKSGRCLVSAARRNGVTLVAVTLNAPDDWADHRAMLNYGVGVCRSELLKCDLSGIEIPVFGSEKLFVKAEIPCETVGLAGEGMKCEIMLRPYLYAPVKKGETVGKILFSLNGRVTAEFPVVTAEEAEFFYAPETDNKPEKEEKFFIKLYRKIKEYFVQR